MPVQSGYTLPSGVKNDVASIKAAQTRLGVKADGIWGPKSNAAYYNPNTSMAPKSTAPKTTAPKSTTAKPTAVGSDTALSNISHKSGYTGLGYTKNGNTYTDYGALVRDDGFFYEPGAKISPNGMYQDVGDGRGMTYAGYATAAKNGRLVAPVKSSMYGASPGAEVMRVSKSGASTTPTTSVTPDATPDTSTTTPVVTPDDVAVELRKREIERQLREYADWQKRLGGY